MGVSLKDAVQSARLKLSVTLEHILLVILATLSCFTTLTGLGVAETVNNLHQQECWTCQGGYCKEAA